MAMLRYRQGRLEEAKAEALCATDVFEKLGAADVVKRCRGLLWKIEEEMNKAVVPRKSDDCELLV